MRPKVIFGTVIFVAVLVMSVAPVFASSTDGTIDLVNRYAWSENVGWIDFGTSQGDVQITSSVLTGYAWGENIGWISLNCSNDNSCGTVQYGVVNDGSGNLSGYAWSENTGWINFAPTGGGVTISSSGVFSGYAWGENIGWIVFNCATTNSCGSVSYDITTDWRPATGGGGGGNSPALPSTVVNVPASYGPPGWTPGENPSSPPPSSPSSQSPQSLVVPVPPVSATSTSTSTSDPSAVIANLKAQLAMLLLKTSTSATVFSRNLSLGMSGSDVKALQEFLISEVSGPAATKLAAHGVTTTFGTLTFSALKEFQKKEMISPASGYFGPVTRAWIAAH